MKKKSKTAPLILPTDSEALKGQIRQLQEKRYWVTRPTVHQIKVAHYNWYWETGSITIDPCIQYKKRGFEAFLALLEANAQVLPMRNWTPNTPITLVTPVDTETL